MHRHIQWIIVYSLRVCLLCLRLLFISQVNRERYQTKLNWFFVNKQDRQYHAVHMYTTDRAQNLKQGIVMKTSFETRVSRMGLGSFVDINIFVMKYFFLLSFFTFSIFVKSLKSNLQNVKTPKRKLGSFVQRYSFKFRAQQR